MALGGSSTSPAEYMMFWPLLSGFIQILNPAQPQNFSGRTFLVRALIRALTRGQEGYDRKRHRDDRDARRMRTRRQKDELSEAKREIQRQKEKLGESAKEVVRLRRELAKFRDLQGDDVASRKRKKSSESSKGGTVARLPTEVWTMIAAKLKDKDVLAFALTSKQHREAQQQAGRKLVTKTWYQRKDGKHYWRYFTEDWCAWWSRRFIVSETREECMNRIIMIAVNFGHSGVLKRYWSKIPEDKIPRLMDAGTCAWAARGGKLETLQWLRSQGCAWDQSTCAQAALHGHLKCLQWARSEGCPWSENTCTWAARGGQLECLQWARSEGCPWSRITCSQAARYGQLECLQWARQNGCPWSANIMCNVATERGHLAALKWVREQGCSWGENTTLVAARNGHLKCFRWLIFQGCPWNRSECRSSGKANIKQWIREQEDLE